MIYLMCDFLMILEERNRKVRSSANMMWCNRFASTFIKKTVGNNPPFCSVLLATRYGGQTFLPHTQHVLPVLGSQMGLVSQVIQYAVGEGVSHTR